MEDGYHTLKGYELFDKARVTATMEDYLEMICRLSQEGGFARISDLARRLNVQPSSASKMVRLLREEKLVTFQRYGVVKLTEEGLDLGEYLLRRHRVLNKFLCRLNHTQDELKQVERIEHFVTRETVENLEQWLLENGG